MTIVLAGRLPLFAEDEIVSSRWLKNAREVAWTPYDEDAEPPQVELTATVTFVDTTGTVFLEDATGSTYLRATTRAKDYWPGQVLHIKGVQSKGLYIQGIQFAQVDILEQVKLPPAQKLTWQQMSSGAYHYQRVQLSGIVRSVLLTGEHTATLEIAIKDHIIELRIDQVNRPLQTLIDANINVEGLLAGAINDRAQLLYPYVRIASDADIKILTPAPEDPFSISLCSLKTLTAKPIDLDSQHRLKLEGVIHKIDVFDGYILNTEDGSILVKQDLPETFQTGDKVEMVGFPRMGAFSIYFENADSKHLNQHQEIAPEIVEEKDVRNGSKNYTWISLKGQAVSTPSSHGSFELKVGTTLVQVNASPEQVRNINYGTLLELSGIIRVTEIFTKDYRAHPAAYELQVCPDDSVHVIAAGPWLKIEHLQWGLGILTASASGFALWVFLLRRQVQRQLRLLQSKLEKELVMEERTRIAREFHDTLEQELAGSSIRLDTIKAVVADQRVKPMLEELRSLLVQMQHETRNFVFNLREQATKDVCFEENLRQLIAHLQATTSLPIRLEISDSNLMIPVFLQHHLLRITREAIHNAIKYAQPSEIRVQVSVEDKQLHLKIIDDGVGFSSNPENLPAGHYGIIGLRERAAKIHAEVQILSNSNEGTTVSLTLPLETESA